MVREIKNTMSVASFDAMRDTVVRMNENVETLIYKEMMNHKADYNPATGLRRTEYLPKSSDLLYGCIAVTGSEGHKIGLEYVTGKEMPYSNERQRAVLYIHGAAFQRRTQDLNLKTAERICDLTGYPVYVPDYRIGIDYDIRETIQDIVDSYRYLLQACHYRAENLTLIADSSGCASLMAALQKLEEHQLDAPGEVILMSPIADAGATSRSVNINKHKDIAFISNKLFEESIQVFTMDGKRDTGCAEVSPIFGDYSHLKNTRILIQVGKDERLLDDSVNLYYKLKQVCDCTLEIYEDMFHNFGTYYTMCGMAKVSWEHYIRFMAG